MQTRPSRIGTAALTVSYVFNVSAKGMESTSQCLVYWLTADMQIFGNFLYASEPLLIINNITGTYYKSVSNSIRKQMEQQVKYYERLYQADEELRRFRHDYKNLRIGLISQLKSNNVAAALQYLENSERPYTRD